MTNKFDSQIQTALSLLDPKDDTHWTQDGLPVVELVAKISELKGLKRGDITKAAPTFTRENPSFEAAKPPEEQDPAAAEGDLPGQDDEALEKANAEAAASTLSEEDIAAKAAEEAPEKEEEELEEDPMDSADAELAEADAALAIANKQLEEAQAAKLAAQAIKDAIVEERAKHVHPHQNQIDIMEFLAGQAKLREQRAARYSTVVSAPKAPIDQAMGRKSGFGHSRPKVPLKTNGA